MLKRPRALLAALALTGLIAVGVLIATVLKLWGPWLPSTGSRRTIPPYWGGFGGVIWSGCSVLLACVCMGVSARPKRRAHYVFVLVCAVAMAGFGIGTGALWTHAGIRDCANKFCRARFSLIIVSGVKPKLTISIAIAVLVLSDVLFLAWVVAFAIGLRSLLKPSTQRQRYETTTERVSREVPREKHSLEATPDTSVGKSSVNPTLGVPVLNSVPTSPLPPPPGISSSPPSRTVALKDTLSSFRDKKMRREGTESTTASLIPYLSPYDLDTLQSMQPGRQRSMDAERDRRSTDEPAPFEVKNVSFGRKSNSSGKQKSRKPIDGLWKQ